MAAVPYCRAVTRLRRAADYAYFDNAGLPLAFAHRGGTSSEHGRRFENSMAAFEAAVGLGYRYLETDAHVTRDGTLLAFHDTTLDRTTDRTGVVTDMTYDELRPARIAGVHPIPLLHELLTSWPDVRLNIDAKSSAAVRPLARLIAEHRAWDRVCVASFSARRLHELRQELGPRVASAYGRVGIGLLRFLPVTSLRRLLLGGGAAAAQVPAAFLPVQRSAAYGSPIDPELAPAARRREPLSVEIVTADFIARAHELGKQVHVWTVDVPEEINRLLDLGADGIMADRIDVLRQVYLSRQIWRTD